MGNDRDVANVVEFLVRDEGAWIQGEVVNADGGFRGARCVPAPRGYGEPDGGGQARARWRAALARAMSAWTCRRLAWADDATVTG